MPKFARTALTMACVLVLSQAGVISMPYIVMMLSKISRPALPSSLNIKGSSLSIEISILLLPAKVLISANHYQFIIPELMLYNIRAVDGTLYQPDIYFIG